MSSHAVEHPTQTSGTDANAPDVDSPLAGGWLVDASCRALDIVVSATLLILTAPLLLAIAVAIRIDSRGPAIFRQERIGRGRKPFTVNKFRSMHLGVTHESHREFVLTLIKGEPHGHLIAREDGPGEGDVDDNGPLYYKMISDPRVTRVGRLLRRSSFDELPQLWNVFRGDMSLVGPRPPIRYEVEHYPREWLERFNVKPGITGLWQVNGRSTVTVAEMIRLDIEYARRRTMWLNIKLLLRTIPAVLSTRGAW